MCSQNSETPKDAWKDSLAKVKEGQLSRQDVELIVGWLRGEWPKAGDVEK